MKPLFDNAIDKLYAVNAYISGHFVTRLHKPTFEDMDAINKNLGLIIKELREEQKKTKDIIDELREAIP